MDDPLFIWTAHHIRFHPVDFYGFRIDWGYEESPMIVSMQNPPLAAYYLAVIGLTLGWSEYALHFGFLIPAVALVLGTYFMARRFCAHPFAAALATLSTPVFLMSSTSVMCDTMMVAFWVWAVFFWVSGLEPENPRRLFLAATLMAACSLTKYFGLCLIPLLVAYSLLQRRRLGRWLLYFLWPILILAAYQWLTLRLYGRGLIGDAASVAVSNRTATQGVARVIETLSFGGGCFFVALPALPLLWGRRGIITGIAGAGAAGLLMAWMKRVGNFTIVEGGHVKWLFLLQISFFLVGGGIILALAIADAAQNRTPASILLLLWVAGVLIFVGGVNWTISGRNILPLAPAAALLIVRRLERQHSDGLRLFWWPLGISLAVALVVAWVDLRVANLARDVARRLVIQIAPHYHELTFEGHWGFQYYMQQLGFRPMTLKPLVLKSDQGIIVPVENTCRFRFPDSVAATDAEYKFTPSKWLSLQNLRSGAGYYSDAWGPIPFVFGPAPPDTYVVYRVK